MSIETQVVEIADAPLKRLERRFSEMAAAMTSAASTAEKEAENARGSEEKLVQFISMSHYRGIATALELAAADVVKARAALQSVLEEWVEV